MLTPKALNTIFCIIWTLQIHSHSLIQRSLKFISCPLFMKLIHSHSYIYSYTQKTHSQLLWYLCTLIHSLTHSRPSQLILWYLLCETVTWHLHTLLGSIFFCERGNSLLIWRGCCTLCTLGSHRTRSGSSFVPRKRNHHIVNSFFFLISDKTFLLCLIIAVHTSYFFLKIQGDTLALIKLCWLSLAPEII